MPRTFEWKSSDGLIIKGRHWPVPAARGVVNLLHGFGEHSGRYEHVAEAFNKEGLAVVAYDRRGHGGSEGKRGHTPGFSYLLEEIDLLLQHSREWYPEEAHILYGHSQGATLALHYAIHEASEELAAVVATSPWIRLAIKANPLKIRLGKLFRKVLPAMAMSNELDPVLLSRDPAVVQVYKNDPLVHDRITPGTGIDMLAYSKELDEFTGTFPLPLLLVHGTADGVTDFEATKSFSERVQGDITFKAWEGLFHETHNEPEQEKTIGFLIGWILEKI